MPSALKALDVPFGDLVDLSEAMVKNRSKIRPKVRARGVLERVIQRLTFQSSRGVEDAMLMLGKRKAFNKISIEISPPQAATDIRARLNRIVHRRNQAVHEGDLQRQSRPQQIRREPTNHAAIQADLDLSRVRGVFRFDHAATAALCEGSRTRQGRGSQSGVASRRL